MKIKHDNGEVTFLMRAGKDFVRGIMSIGYAQSLVSIAKSVVEEDGQIIVDDRYFFPTEPTEKRTPKRKKSEGDEE